MKERPILFSGPMVRAILEGRKTQTRRVVKWAGNLNGKPYLNIRNRTKAVAPAFLSDLQNIPEIRDIVCPFGMPGDRLWVRESFYIDHCDYSEGGRLGSERPDGVTDDQIYYPADAAQDRPHWCCQTIPECCCHEVGRPRVRSGRFMPRWASRITLEITNIRVERLQDISEDDAKAEGIELITGEPMYADEPVQRYSAKAQFRGLWDKINGKKHPWAENPWVWVVEIEDAKGGTENG